jgi:hypothetical protein
MITLQVLELKKMETEDRTSIQTVVVDGVHVTLDPAVFDDMDILETIVDIEDGNGARIVTLMRRIFGDDYTRIKSELKGNKKVLTVTAMAEWVEKMMEELGQKN